MKMCPVHTHRFKCSQFVRPRLLLLLIASCLIVSCDYKQGPGANEAPALKFISAGGPSFANSAFNTWRLASGPADRPSYWVANFDARGIKGKKLTGKMRLTVSAPVKATISVMRAGSTPKEGSDVGVNLVPGQRKTFEISHLFTQDHSRVKLQVAVTDGAPGTVFTIDDISLTEAPTL